MTVDCEDLPLSAKPLDPGDPTVIAHYEIVALLGRGAIVIAGDPLDQGLVQLLT